MCNPDHNPIEKKRTRHILRQYIIPTKHIIQQPLRMLVEHEHLPSRRRIELNGSDCLEELCHGVIVVVVRVVFVSMISYQLYVLHHYFIMMFII